MIYSSLNLWIALNYLWVQIADVDLHPRHLALEFKLLLQGLNDTFYYLQWYKQLFSLERKDVWLHKRGVLIIYMQMYVVICGSGLKRQVSDLAA